MRKIRIVIIDDYAIVRAGLRMLIEAQPDMEVVAEAKGGREMLAHIGKIKPEVTTIDIQMSEANGIHTIEHLLRVCPDTRILVVTGYADSAYAHSALAVGALGYISKHTSAANLLAAIRAVYEGRCFVEPDLLSPLLQGFLHKRTIHSAQAIGIKSLLSQREAEALKLFAQGHTNREIADQMGIGVRTVETYRSRIVTKLDLHKRADLIRFAYESGILTTSRGTTV